MHGGSNLRAAAYQCNTPKEPSGTNGYWVHWVPIESPLLTDCVIKRAFSQVHLAWISESILQASTEVRFLLREESCTFRKWMGLTTTVDVPWNSTTRA